MAGEPGSIEPVGRGQFLWFVAISVVAGGVYIWPETLMRDAGPEAPWCILASILAAMALISLDLWWASRTGGRVFFDRLLHLWGPGAWLWIVGNGVLLILLDATVISLFSDMIQSFYYPRTPLWLIRGSLLILAGWFGGLRLAQVTRATQFWLPILLAGFCLLALASMGHLERAYVLVPRVSPIDGSELLSGIITMWYLWMESSVVLTLAPSTRPSTLRAVWSATMVALAVQGLAVITIYIVVVGTLGPWVTALLAWPLLYVLNNLPPIAFIIARGSALIVPTWALAALFYVTTHIVSMSLNLEVALGGSRRTYRALAAGAALAIFSFTWLWSSPHAVTRFVVGLWDPVAMAWSVGITLLATGTSLVRGRGRAGTRHEPAASGKRRQPAPEPSG